MQFIEVITDLDSKKLINVSQICEVKELIGHFSNTCDIIVIGCGTITVLHSYQDVKEMILKPKFNIPN